MRKWRKESSRFVVHVGQCCISALTNAFCLSKYTTLLIIKCVSWLSSTFSSCALNLMNNLEKVTMYYSLLVYMSKDNNDSKFIHTESFTQILSNILQLWIHFFFIISKIHRMSWVGRNIKDHLVPTLCCR